MDGREIQMGGAQEKVDLEESCFKEAHPTSCGNESAFVPSVAIIALSICSRMPDRGRT